MKQELNEQLKKQIENLSDYPYSAIAAYIFEIKKLLKNGADIDTQAKNGETLLHFFASEHKKIEAYNSYIKHTLETNPQLKEKYTLTLTDVISQYQPNPFIKNDKGLTASYLAAQNNYTKQAQLLLSYENAYQANLNAQAFEALSQIIQKQQYKKAEQVIQQDNSDFIIERYLPTDHQPEPVVKAKNSIQNLAQKLRGDFQNG